MALQQLKTAATYLDAAVSRKVIMCWWFKLVMLELDDDHSNVDQSFKTCIGTAMREVEQPSHLQQSHVFVSALSS